MASYRKLTTEERARLPRVIPVCVEKLPDSQTVRINGQEVTVVVDKVRKPSTGARALVDRLCSQADALEAGACGLTVAEYRRNKYHGGTEEKYRRERESKLQQQREARRSKSIRQAYENAFH